MSLDLDRNTLRNLIDSGSEREFQAFFQRYNELVLLSDVLIGDVAPTFKADRHRWYLDTATNKYYRNVDGALRG